MKRIVWLASIFIFFNIHFKLFSQNVEKFNNNLYLSSNLTYGNKNLWLIDQGRLRSNSTTPNSSFYLSNTFTITGEQIWDFDVELNFATSGSNYLDFFLFSNQSNLLSTSVSGYFVRIGNTNDEISLYKRTNGTNQILINGRNKTVSTTGSNFAKVRVHRKENGAFSLWYNLKATQINFFKESEALDNTFTGTGFRGILVRQSSASFFRKHFIDNIEIYQKLNPEILPQISEIKCTSTNFIQLTFSQPLGLHLQSLTSAGIVGKPHLQTQIICVESFPHTVEIGFNIPLPDFAEIKLPELKSIWGTSKPIETKDFVCKSVPSTKKNDIRITEIMFDPTPNVFLPESEYLEIFNNTNTEINLKNWTISGVSTKGMESYWLPAKECVVLCADTSKFSALMPKHNWGNTSGSVLSNNGEKIQLISPQNQVIDEVFYLSTWHTSTEKKDGGWSLEKSNLTSDCQNAQNWSSSVDPNGGTPAKINSSPKVEFLKPISISNTLIKDNNQFEIEFSDKVNQVEINSFKGENSIFVLDSVLNSAFLSLKNESINLEKIYSIKVSSVLGCNELPIKDTIVTFQKGTEPKPYQILITEIYADFSPGMGLPSSQMIEIYNASNLPLNLSKLKICDKVTCASLPQAVIMPEQYLILTSNTNEIQWGKYGKTLGINSFPSFNQDVEKVFLRNEKNVNIHHVWYQKSWYRDFDKDDGGFSLEMMNIKTPCLKSENWQASLDAKGGTPGQKNSVFSSNADSAPPTILSAFAQNKDSLVLLFSEPFDSLNTKPKLDLNSNLQTANFFLNVDAQKIIFKVSPEFEKGRKYHFSVSGVQDCAINAIDSSRFYEIIIPEEANKSDIIINEILFNPKPEGADFVEIYNRSSKYINLQAWSFCKFDKDSISDCKPIVEESFLISPAEYWAFTPNKKANMNLFPKSKEANYLEIKTLPSLPDDEGSIVICDAQKNIIDAFVYSDKMHLSFLKKTEGVSLERINLEWETQNSNNWQSASQNSGWATPTLPNSQSKNTTSNGTFSLEPLAITPNGDGNADFTILSYSVAKAGLVANIKLYDLSANEIYVLAKQVSLSRQGEFKWDGSDFLGNKARNGIYLVHIELFGQNGELEKYVLKVGVTE